MAGAMGHGPEMFQTFNQQHNPLQKIWKNCKNLWSAKTRSPMGPDGPRWAPMGPDGPRWAPMGQPLKRITTNRSPTNYLYTKPSNQSTHPQSIRRFSRPSTRVQPYAYTM